MTGVEALERRLLGMIQGQMMGPRMRVPDEWEKQQAEIMAAVDDLVAAVRLEAKAGDDGRNQ